MSNPQEENRIVVNARFLTRPVTGLERYAIEMALHLKKARPSLTFLVSNDVLHESIAEELGAKIHGMLKGHLWEQIELPLFLRSNNSPLLINLMNTGPITYRRQLTVVHDISFLRNPAWFSRAAAMWFTFLVPRVVNASSGIVVDSAFTKSELMDRLNVPAEKIHLVHPGIAQIFQPPGDGGTKNRTKAMVLAVSTLEPRKNVERLIEAINLLTVKDARFVIVGGVNSLVFAKSGVRKDDHAQSGIEFMGYVTDAQLIDLYHQADIFASVSLYEGFGFPPLEAFACGCRVLVSDIPPHREIFGDQATYVDPLDPADIARKLHALLTTQESDVAGRAERAATLSRFDWRQAAEKLLRVADEH